jgi:hypothetical protein
VIIPHQSLADTSSLYLPTLKDYNMLATVAVLAFVTKALPNVLEKKFGAEHQTRLPYRGAAFGVPYVLEQTRKERRDR